MKVLAGLIILALVGIFLLAPMIAEFLTRLINYPLTQAFGG